MDPFGRPRPERPGMRLHCVQGEFPPFTGVNPLQADASETLILAIVASHITGTPDRFSDAVNNAEPSDRHMLGAPEEGITDELYKDARACAAKIVRGECALFEVVENDSGSGAPFEIVRKQQEVETMSIETNTPAPAQRIVRPTEE